MNVGRMRDENGRGKYLARPSGNNDNTTARPAPDDKKTPTKYRGGLQPPQYRHRSKD